MGVSRVLIANRGEIAVRIIRACRALGLEAVLAVSEADRESLPARMADRVVCIGPASAQHSYLNIGAIVAAALGTGADAVHPGYGFLAESPELAEACAEYGLVFVGPRPEQIRLMGNKLEARRLAERCGVPVLPGSEPVRSAGEAVRKAEEIGFPVMLKAAAGGGGRGMKVAHTPRELEAHFAAAAGEARAAFGDDTLYLERYVPHARHVEVQILADAHGTVLHLGDRDCSLQRRHQKVVEEALAPNLSDSLRTSLWSAAVTLARSMGYLNAGTLEFLVDVEAERFYFLEMNTRIQVEHPVTEAVTGIDIVQEQFRIAAGEPLRWRQEEVRFAGHAIECRLTAEDATRAFQPSPGRITVWNAPQGPGIRLDTHCFAGYEVPVYYDSLLGKLIAYGQDREEAVRRMQEALGAFRVEGIATTIPFLRFVVSTPEFQEGRVHTRLLQDLIHRWQALGAATPGRVP
ncbi:MAG: acetyl-CoA carboxylase biotin carboxylase subunit [Armatimonadota bacterium]|nr:acetyl-CoA carboxylase biotin carboxylase subunit [Armatimonadota bacterium]MDR7443889.1 acetyl-CoA carboxylase biotin carboxylase subunit [Armatimonadota bacterium]MDR7571070.1 acetyl-CoA carboxylase biotin carboxylase subunit [Armatimonadota bacterium]MDR7615469.1 acetyl-CoA carboxylase biotin carboxylase subunit [Armatimonadota bacterium]